jgi:hypothetical protein
MPSNSVPSPYVRGRLGRRRSFGTAVGERVVLRRGTDDRMEDIEGGRGGKGEEDRVRGDSCVGLAELPNTWDSAGRAFKRDCVGIVSRRAAGLEEGVDGRVGGTLKS